MTPGSLQTPVGGRLRDGAEESTVTLLPSGEMAYMVTR
jgi:hypothetical protein